MNKIFSRMGDGSALWLTVDDLKHELKAGSEDAADRGKIDPLGTITAHERTYCLDTFEVEHFNYSFRTVKIIISEERQSTEQIQLNATIPVCGAMPNLCVNMDLPKEIMSYLQILY